MPNISGWDTGFGISGMTGTVKSGANDPATETHVKGWTVDAQLQGNINSLPFGFYASYGKAPKGTTGKPNHYNSSTTNDETAYGLVAKLDAIPNTFQVYLAHSSHKVTTTTDTVTAGVQYMVAQNMKLELYRVNSDSTSTGDDYTMLMLFAGF